MIKNARLRHFLFIISVQFISMPTWSHVINWQLSNVITSNSQNYDTQVKWLDDIPLYLPGIKEDRLVETLVQGLTQIQVLDHSSSQSIANLSNIVIQELRASGFELMFQCTNSECNQPNQWNKQLKDYLNDMSENQAYLVGYRDKYLGRISSDPGQIRGEYLHAYLNEIGCCVRSIWRYTELSQISVPNNQPTILFDTNSFQLSNMAKLMLNTLVGDLKINDKTYQIVGHTDSRGSETFNYDLAEQRAVAVINYMVSQGISADRLTQTSMGSSQPVISNESATSRRLNRRVEIVHGN